MILDTTKGQLQVPEITLSDREKEKSLLGPLFIAFYAFYNLFILFLYIKQGDKGSFRSAFFLFVLMVLFLLFAGNLWKLLKDTLKRQSTYLLVAFILYFFIAAMLSQPDVRSQYFSQLYATVILSFLLGFIAFSDVRTTGLDSIVNFRFNPKSFLIHATLAITIAYVGIGLFFLRDFLSMLDARFFKILTDNTALISYQGFGDSYTMAFICTAGIQYLFYKIRMKEKGFLIFAGIIIAETVLAFVCLQLVGSSKSPVLILMIALLFLWYAKPHHWLTRGRFLKKRTMVIIPLLLLIVAVALQRISQLDFKSITLFDLGNAESVLQNTSLTSRVNQAKTEGMDMLIENPILGKLQLNYIHSSVVSLQSHLGIIGSLLLWSFISIRLIATYNNPGYVMIKSLAIPILLMAAISSFFTWEVLWFFIGALATAGTRPKNLLRIID
jgi:hypothetical protein